MPWRYGEILSVSSHGTHAGFARLDGLAIRLGSLLRGNRSLALGLMGYVAIELP